MPSAIARSVLTLIAITAGVARSQTPAAAPKFEVASIKPCGAATGGGGGGREGGGGGRSTEIASPGRIHFECVPLTVLIQSAYLLFANGQRHSYRPGDAPPIEGGPAWAHSDRYSVEAKAEGVPSEAIMMGPMMQALLEDRFKLKIREEARDVPVYELTVAKGGLKMQPVEPDGCVFFDFSQFPPHRPEPGATICRNIDVLKGRSMIVDTHAMSMDQFARSVLMWLDRPVIDKTGVSGLFDFRFEYTPDETSPGFGHLAADDPGEPPGPSIFTALQQFGLKLEAAKGTGDFIVIDSVERPSGN